MTTLDNLLDGCFSVQHPSWCDLSQCNAYADAGAKHQATEHAGTLSMEPDWLDLDGGDVHPAPIELWMDQPVGSSAVTILLSAGGCTRFTIGEAEHLYAALGRVLTRAKI